jgi:hypothetical protein
MLSLDTVIMDTNSGGSHVTMTVLLAGVLSDAKE